MRTSALSGTFLATMLLLLLNAAPAHAQLTRTWVSAGGDDANTCDRTAPCKTFAGAILKTAINGEIQCVDAANFGALTISKSLTIDCHEVVASINASGLSSCITISLATTVTQDPLQTVRLRNLNCSGGSGNSARNGVQGINITNAKAVFLDDIRIDGFINQGVRDVRTNAAGRLYIRNSIIRDNGGAGVAVASIGNPPVMAVIENSHLTGNATGVAVGANNAVMVARSVMTGNVNAGVATDRPERDHQRR